MSHMRSKWSLINSLELMITPRALILVTLSAPLTIGSLGLSSDPWTYFSYAYQETHYAHVWKGWIAGLMFEFQLKYSSAVEPCFPLSIQWFVRCVYSRSAV